MLREAIQNTGIETDPAPTWAHEPGSDCRGVARARRAIRDRRAALEPAAEQYNPSSDSRTVDGPVRAIQNERAALGPTSEHHRPQSDWRTVDSALRSIRDNRAALEPASEHHGQPDWRTVDGALRAIRNRRAALDAEEMYWLREAEALQIWRPLGMVSAIDYLERVLGYAPRTAQDRLRVARALGSLPQLSTALADGRLPFSAIRELTRVTTPATEAAWVAAATGKNLRQIEELVADHRQGDNPDDPPDPEARTHNVRFELAAETFALLRQARMVVNDEHGRNVSDDTFVAALCGAALEGAPASEPTGRAKFQIALTVCRRCQQGWQEGAGAQVTVDAAVVDRAHCDAQHIGSIDGPAPERAYQDIPPSVARFVWRRDGGRCRVDGCRSSRGLELHHVIHRADGGTHDPCNVVLCCSSCHQAHHAGLLTMSGTAQNLIVRRHSDASSVTHPAASQPSSAPGLHETSSRSSAADAHVGAASRLDAAILRTQAKDALTALGWKPAIAHAAVNDAVATHGLELTLERLIFESLRRCPAPRL